MAHPLFLYSYLIVQVPYYIYNKKQLIAAGDDNAVFSWLA